MEADGNDSQSEREFGSCVEGDDDAMTDSSVKQAVMNEPQMARASAEGTAASVSSDPATRISCGTCCADRNRYFYEIAT